MTYRKAERGLVPRLKIAINLHDDDPTTCRALKALAARAIARIEADAVAIAGLKRERDEWEQRALGLSLAEKKAQGARCRCHGSDDYCPCQNRPDGTTLRERRERKAVAPPAAYRFYLGERIMIYPHALATQFALLAGWLIGLAGKHGEEQTIRDVLSLSEVKRIARAEPDRILAQLMRQYNIPFEEEEGDVKNT